LIAPALAFALALAPAPSLLCPPQAEHLGASPPDGYEEWCEVKDPAGHPRREGPARTYYDNGGIWVESCYREGRLQGPFLERYRDGVSAREGAYAKGEKEGIWRAWYQDGTLEEESNWLSGQRDGPFVAYWPNGEKKQAGQHCLGAQCGVWRAFDEAGRELGMVEYGGGWRAEP
jgi:antitoxin component YwqK of YwqJK toxin-antitoxin module